MSVESLHDLETTSLQGQPVELARYRGTVVLAVNVASECGLTPQYEGLQALHSELAPRGFSVLGFPSNDFGGQEPGTADKIQSFCERNYGVTFPMFAKLQTRPGPGQSPIYAFLTRGGQAPTWNFGKYLVGKDGKVIRFFASDVPPDAKPLREAILQALAA
ncbi:MAG TPA: glutathione peroxidase [Vicinamibacteria bacterium]|nr:glutathione peroxidase [Vicinamibacteria bacterium]